MNGILHLFPLTLGFAATTMALIAAGLAIATAAGSAAMQADAARKQNNAIKDAAKAQAKGVAAQQRELVNAANIERSKRLKEGQQIEGRLRVAAGEAGVGFGGSYEALANQNTFDTATNLTILNQSLNNQLASVQSGFQANRAELSSHIQNALVSSVGAGVQGFSTGLSIGGGLTDLNTALSTPKTTTKAA